MKTQILFHYWVTRWITKTITRRVMTNPHDNSTYEVIVTSFRFLGLIPTSTTDFQIYHTPYFASDEYRHEVKKRVDALERKTEKKIENIF